MDISQLCSILSATVDPLSTNDSIHQAENMLKQVEHVPGYTPLLLYLAANQTVPPQVQLAAILRFKNVLIDHWRHASDSDEFISREDKKTIMSTMFESIVGNQNMQLKGHLCTSLYYVLQGLRDPELGFGKGWILEQCLAEVANGTNALRIYNSVSCLYQILKRFQYKVEEKDILNRNSFTQIIFPLLLKTLGSCTTDEGISLELARQCVKCYRVILVSHLTPVMQETVSEWVNILLAHASRPDLQNTNSNGESLKSNYWKKMKTITKVLTLLFKKYGFENYADEDIVPFAKKFSKNYVGLIYSYYISVIKAYSNGTFVSDRVLNSIFEFLLPALKLTTLFKTMKKDLDYILFGCIFKVLSLKQEDLLLWENDPVEFIRRDSDIEIECIDPRTSATTLMYDLVKERTKFVITPLFDRVMQMLSDYDANPSNDLCIINKDLAVRVIGSLSDLLSKTHIHAIEQMLANNILCDFKSPIGFLRARANWFVQRYFTEEINVINADLYLQTVKCVFESLVNSNEALPVRTDAAAAMTRIVSSATDFSIFQNHIPSILEALFFLVEEIGNEDVVHILGVMIDRMGSDISPFACDMCRKFVSLFLPLSAAPLDDDDSSVTASAILGNINTILHGLKIYIELEDILKPYIETVWENQLMDFMDDVLETITCLTYYGKPNPISPYMWSQLPRILDSYTHYANDYLSSMIHPIDNYICHGSEFLLANPQLMVRILELCKSILVQTGMSSEVDSQYASKIIENLVGSMIGKIDLYFGAIYRLIVERLNRAGEPLLKYLLVNAVAALAYYNSSLFIKEALETGTLEFVLNVWMSLCDPAQERNDLKDHKSFTLSSHQSHMAIIGLCSFLKIPFSSMPAPLQLGLPNILKVIVDLLEFNETRTDDSEDENDDDENFDDDDDENVVFNDIDEDEDAINLSEKEYLNQLQEKFAAGLTNNDTDSHVSDDDFESPLDESSINHVVYFGEVFSVLGSLSPEFFSNWKANLSAEQSSEIQKWLQLANDEVNKESK